MHSLHAQEIHHNWREKKISFLSLKMLNENYVQAVSEWFNCDIINWNLWKSCELKIREGSKKFDEKCSRNVTDRIGTSFKTCEGALNHDRWVDASVCADISVAHNLIKGIPWYLGCDLDCGRIFRSVFFSLIFLSQLIFVSISISFFFHQNI